MKLIVLPLVFFSGIATNEILATAQKTMEQASIAVKPGTQEKVEQASNAKELWGFWVGDAKKTLERMKGPDFDEAKAKPILNRVRATQVDFSKDGTIEVVAGGRKFSGKWKAERSKSKGDTSVLSVFVIPNNESGFQEKTFQISFLGEKHILLVDPGDKNGPPLVLKRKKKGNTYQKK